MTNNDAPAPVPNYRALQGLVIFLGVLMGLALVALVVGAVMRMSSTGLPTGAPFQASLPAPNQHIESTQLDGNRILVHLAGEGTEELVVLDAGSGRVLGRVVLDPKP